MGCMRKQNLPFQSAGERTLAIALLLALLMSVSVSGCGMPAKSAGGPGTVSIRMGGEMGMFAGTSVRH